MICFWFLSFMQCGQCSEVLLTDVMPRFYNLRLQGKVRAEVRISQHNSVGVAALPALYNFILRIYLKDVKILWSEDYFRTYTVLLLLQL
jgi:hypothetical protein